MAIIEAIDITKTYQMGEVGTSVLEPPVYLIWGAAVVGLSTFSLQFVGLFFDSLIELSIKEVPPHE